MAVHGDRPPGGAGGALRSIVTGPHLAGAGTAASPLDLTAREAARLDGLHDAMRERVGAWDVVAAAIDDGNAPPTTVAYGYRDIVNNAPTDAPSLVTGSIVPAPAELRRGASTWRIVALTQLVAGDRNVEIILGAPSTDRRIGAPNVHIAAADTWVAVPGVTVAAARRTTYTLRIAGGAAQYVRADTLRALTAAVAGGDATTAGTSHAVAGDYVLGITAARGLLIAHATAAGQVAVTVDADDGPSAAEAAAPPADVDWRIGDTVLRYRDATVTYAPRSTLGGRYWESTRTLTWSDVPAGTVAAGTVEVTAMGPAVESTGVYVADAAPDHPPVGQPWMDVSDEDDIRARIWHGSGWEGWLAERIPAVAALPPRPIAQQVVLLVAQSGAHAPGLYACRAHGTWEHVGGGPAVQEQSTISRPSTWARAWIRAATEAAALAGVAAATWTDDGPGTPPTGAVWSRVNLQAGALPAWELVSQVGWSAGWAFTGWSALREGAQGTQYSVDGATAWHYPWAPGDAYGRRRAADGGWSAAYRLAHTSLDWTTLCVAQVRWASRTQGQTIHFDAPIDFRLVHDVVLDVSLTEYGGQARHLSAPIWLRLPQTGTYANRDGGHEPPYTFIFGADTSGIRRYAVSWAADQIAATYAGDVWQVRCAAKFSRGQHDGLFVASSLRLIMQNSWNNRWGIGVRYR